MFTPYKIFNDDCLSVLKETPDNSLDSLVTDPPAGIGLLGLKWDDNKGGRDQWINWLSEIMRECHRVLKPGAYGFIWAIPRTSHWTGMALENAGFKIKDVVTHVYGSGFPKSLAIEKAIDRAKYSNSEDIYKVTSWIRQKKKELGLTNYDLDKITETKGGASHWTARRSQKQASIPPLEKWKKLKLILGEAPYEIEKLIKPAHELGSHWVEREVTGKYTKNSGGLGQRRFVSKCKNKTKTNNPQAKIWEGFGTALKPASEHWILIQKPMSEHNIAANIIKYKVGGLNIDASRVKTKEDIAKSSNPNFIQGHIFNIKPHKRNLVFSPHTKGRFPSNFIFTKSQDKNSPDKILEQQANKKRNVSNYFKSFRLETPFFYCSKPTKKEKGEFNHHPTVKPLALMRYLAKMITPPGGTLLDPFMGSGTTGVAALFERFKFVGIEKENSYFQISQRRLNGALNKTSNLKK